MQGPRGEHGFSVADLLQPPAEARRSESLLGADELIMEVRIPRSTGLRMTYRKAMDRKTWAFALVGVATALRLRERTVTEAPSSRDCHAFASRLPSG